MTINEASISAAATRSDTAPGATRHRARHGTGRDTAPTATTAGGPTEATETGAGHSRPPGDPLITPRYMPAPPSAGLMNKELP